MPSKPLTSGIKHILEEYGATDIIAPWVIKEGLCDVDDIGLLATDEKEVPANFIAKLDPPLHDPLKHFTVLFTHRHPPLHVPGFLINCSCEP